MFCFRFGGGEGAGISSSWKEQPLETLPLPQPRAPAQARAPTPSPAHRTAPRPQPRPPPATAPQPAVSLGDQTTLQDLTTIAAPSQILVAFEGWEQFLRWGTGAAGERGRGYAEHRLVARKEARSSFVFTPQPQRRGGAAGLHFLQPMRAAFCHGNLI